MDRPPQTLSVAQAATLCRVNRNTIGLWIRSGKLRANRVGRNYSIPVEELLFFLKSTGQKIPVELGGEKLTGPYFRTIQNCWQYFKEESNIKDCEQCTVFKNQLDVCFISRDSSTLHDLAQCNECDYYRESYASRIEFIHQIAFPAAIHKDLYFWGGNRKWADLCEVQEKDLVGMGIEKVIHPDSLETVISNNKKRAFGDPSVPRTSYIFLKNSKRGKLEVQMAVYPLTEPSGTWLLLAESLKNEHR
jgi:excisionase family DNA binding protein